MLNYQRVNGGFLIALITRRVSLKKLSLRLSTCIQMVCVCVSTNRMLSIIVRMGTSFAKFSKVNLHSAGGIWLKIPSQSLAVFPFWERQIQLDQYKNCFYPMSSSHLSSVPSCSTSCSISFTFYINYINIIYQPYHGVHIICRFRHHQFPHPKTRLVPRLTHCPWITKVPCAPVTVPTKAKPKDSGSCGSKVWPSVFEKMGEMAMEIWGKHGEKPWKSMGNPWEKLGKSGRSGENQRVQWSRLPWK